jgi:hypothetical protein
MTARIQAQPSRARGHVRPFGHGFQNDVIHER